MTTESAEVIPYKPTSPPVTSEDLDLIKRTVANGATDSELKLFMFDCRRRGVHPLDKLIHFTKRGGKYTPVTSIDYMRAQAARSGEMAGSDDATFDDDGGESGLVSATVTVYRLTRSQRFAYTATARWEEYCPGPGQDHMWRKMPRTMLAKCAEALALRKAFPQQLAGLHVDEELHQAARVGDPVTPPATVVDAATGEDVPAASRPPAPPGYRYIDAYREENGWHHAEFYDPTRQRPAEHYKTKLAKIGALVRKAFEQGIPVACDISPNTKRGEPGWINGVVLYEPGADLEAAERVRNEEDDPPA